MYHNHVQRRKRDCIVKNVILDYPIQTFFNEIEEDTLNLLRQDALLHAPDPTDYRLPILTDSIVRHSSYTKPERFLEFETGIRLHVRKGIQGSIRLHPTLEKDGAVCLNNQVTSSYNLFDLPIMVSATPKFDLHAVDIFAYIYFDSECVIQDFIENDTRQIFVF